VLRICQVHLNLALAKYIPDTFQNLREWFYEMFKYAGESEVANTVVIKLLGANGPFQNDDYLQKQLGARFVLALTEANPKAALVCLNLFSGKKDRFVLREKC